MHSLFAHQPVMTAEVIAGLQPGAGGFFVDATVGGAGHATAILSASSPTGKLFGCDRDADALIAAQSRLVAFAGRFELKHGNFAELPRWLAAASCDGVLFDLGVSSPQFDRPERGFSFREGPLDMRMDTRQALTAATLVNEASAEELARIFWEFGGERESRRYARAIVKQREQRRFGTTRELADLIETLGPRGKKTHPATKAFQALRMAVNDEAGSLKLGLAGALVLLKPRGRLAVLTFHSVEDRIVKEFGRTSAREYTFAGNVDVPELRKPCMPELKIITRKAIKPSPDEVAANPRSRSAQLRIFEKL